MITELNHKTCRELYTELILNVFYPCTPHLLIRNLENKESLISKYLHIHSAQLLILATSLQLNGCEVISSVLNLCNP